MINLSDEMFTLRVMLEQEKHNLDLFNLEVAKFRLKYGMFTGLIRLYGAMGNLCRRLMAIESEVQGIACQWGKVTGSFQLVKDKEERDEGKDTDSRGD